jgi:hypothetical protein
MASRFAGAKVRSRKLPVIRPHCRYEQISLLGGQNSILDGYLDTSGWTGTQVTESFSHPAWKSRSRSSSLSDIGGPFFTQKTYTESNLSPFSLNDVPRVKGYTTTTKYVGAMLPYSPTAMSFPTASVSSKSALDARGATAVARCSPTNSAADLSVFLGELMREGLPKLIGASSGLWEEKTRIARKTAGDEYLNLQYGWVPIAQDMSSIAYAIYAADAILRQYERDSGRLVRRTYHFPSEESVSFTTISNAATPYILGGVSGDLVDPNASTLGKVYREDRFSRRQWFSGAFTYHLPDSYSRSSEMARIALQAKKLMGVSLTPSTAWNLAPWSWAVDWFSNVGDVLDNVSDSIADRLVMSHGYMMEHTVNRRTYHFAGPTWLRTKTARPAPVSFVVETKIRQQANPYGFGLTWDGLNAFQLSILTALGMTRGR